MNKKLFVILSLALFIALPVCAETDYPNLPHKELIFPLLQVPSSHASSIAELPNGELLAVWYAPSGANSAIWGSRRPVGAKKWTKPSIIHKTPGYNNKNPVLYVDENKKLWLLWSDEKRWIFKIVKDILKMKTSPDSGRTWSEPRNVGGCTWFLARTPPIKLKNGWMVLPVYTDLSTSAAAVVSKDGGLTWEGPKYLLFFFGIQPTMIQRSDSSIFALMRTGMWPRLAWQAISRDSGMNWHDRRYSNVDNPGSSLAMMKLKDGNVVLAFNNSKTDRSGISLALSCDEGRTWPYVKVIEYGADNVYGYPSVIQDRHGLIHVTYSYNNRDSIAHFVTTEEWIKK